VWTIGYGQTRINGRPVGYAETCTQAQAEAWATLTLREVALQILTTTAAQLADHQLAALISFVYNVGIGHFRNSGVLKALNAGDYQLAADRLLEFDRAGGRPMRGLDIRRQRERALFLNEPGAAPLSDADRLNQQQLDKET
jgi:lysozyme